MPFPQRYVCGPNDPTQRPAHAGQNAEARITLYRVAGLLQRLVRSFAAPVRASPPDSAPQLGLPPADALRQPPGAEVLHGRTDAQLPRHRPPGGVDYVNLPVVAEKLALPRR